MAVNGYELDMLRRNTTAYIDADLSVVTLERQALVDDGAGGKRRGDAIPVAPQNVRIVNGQIPQVVRQDANGKAVTADYLMIMEWDADVQPEDLITLNGYRYKVVYVYPDPTYERLAELHFLGTV